MAVSPDAVLQLQARVTAAEESGFAREQEIKQAALERKNLQKLIQDLQAEFASKTQIQSQGLAQVQGELRADQAHNRASDQNAKNVMDQLVSKMNDVLGQLGALEQRVKDVEKAQPIGIGRESAKRVDLMNMKGTSTIPVYTGKPEEYEMWASKMRNLLISAHKAYRKILPWINEQDADFDDTIYDDAMDQLNLESDDVAELTEQLWFLISSKTDGAIFHMLRNLEAEGDGARGARVV